MQNAWLRYGLATACRGVDRRGAWKLSSATAESQSIGMPDGSSVCVLDREIAPMSRNGPATRYTIHTTRSLYINIGYARSPADVTRVAPR